MSLQPQPITPIPEDTSRVARVAFPHGNLYMRMRDEMGAIYEDAAFAPLFPTRGQPAEAPWRLALVTILQYAEGLSDRQAADAVRSRIDWKYALSLELTDPGFDSSVLSEFRTRLVAGHAEAQMLNTLLQLCRERKLLQARGRQRTDSTHVLAAVHALNRLECAAETMRHALNSLAVVAPQWLLAHSQAEWLERYGPRAEDYRLPKGQEKRRDYALVVGRDGVTLLQALYARESPLWLRQIPAVEMLRQVWLQQYCRTGQDLTCADLHWRTEKEGLPPSTQFIGSPYDAQAHYAKKRNTAWMGYKVHLSETCDDDTPHLITHVETTPAPIVDGECTPRIHQALQAKDLLPSIHLMDTGYVYAQWLLSSRQEYEVDLLGPTRSNYHWQAQAATGFAARDFVLDWQRREATCPQGRRSSCWTPLLDKNHNPVIKVQFSQEVCGRCDSRPECTRNRRRTLLVQPQPLHEALQAARQRETTAAYAAQYQKRAGVEGTISQGVRAFGLRRARYVGLAKTHLQHVLTATAMNFVRVSHWLQNKPLAQTRQSSFTRLMAATSAAV